MSWTVKKMTYKYPQTEANKILSPPQALISVTPDEETYDEEDAAFCLEMLLRIVLENR